VAGFCSSKRCNLALTNSGFIGAAMFGTVHLSLSSNIVTIDVDLASACRIMKTGFTGTVGFIDNLDDRLTIDNFKTDGVSTHLYPGSQARPSSCTTKNCCWTTFGYMNNGAATNGPNRPDNVLELLFAVNKEVSITNVRQLLQQFSDSNGL
jgi:hypothetical protein